VNCRTFTASANVPKVKVTTAYTPPPKSTAVAMPTTTASAAGTATSRRSASRDATRHGSAGPTPMRKSSAMHSGSVMLLKNGSPTLTLTPRTASATSGKSVPNSTVKVNTENSRLLSRNAVSRDATASRRPAVCS
jgi:hypothetical protein